MKTAVLSVVYPEAAPFLGEFFGSLAAQTDRDFVLWLVNDGMESLEGLLKNFDLKARVRDSRGPQAALRKAGIGFALAAGCEAIVFADADDRFAPNRVEISKETLKSGDAVFNELVLFGNGVHGELPLLGPRFREGQRIREPEILHSNCLGLSNTAVRSKAAAEAFAAIPDTAPVFDWAFFTRLLHGGREAVYTGRTATYYRQHEHNAAPPLGLDDERILAGVRVKADHYSGLAELGEPYPAQARIFKELNERQTKDDRLRRLYCEAVRKNAPRHPLWWEAMKTPEELGV